MLSKLVGLVSLSTLGIEAQSMFQPQTSFTSGLPTFQSAYPVGFATSPLGYDFGRTEAEIEVPRVTVRGQILETRPSRELTRSTGYGTSYGFLGQFPSGIPGTPVATVNDEIVRMRNPFNQYTRETLLADTAPITPFGADISPNAADEYVNRLYAHGKALLNRALARIGAGAMDGPLIVPFGVHTPMGYQPQSMDQIYSLLFFYLGRCFSSPFFFRAQNRAVDRIPHTNDALADCLIEQGTTWLDDMDDYVANEAKNVLKYLKQHPWVPVRNFATYANVLRTHRVSEIQAMLETPLAVYRLGEALVTEARRVTSGNARFVPDMDGILATPAAWVQFGFPRGFVVEGAEDLFSNLVFKLMLCRSGAAVRSPLFSDNFFEDGAPGGAFSAREKCMTDYVFDWYLDDYDDFGTATAVAVADFLRPTFELPEPDMSFFETADVPQSPTLNQFAPMFTPADFAPIRQEFDNVPQTQFASLSSFPRYADGFSSVGNAQQPDLSAFAPAPFRPGTFAG